MTNILKPILRPPLQPILRSVFDVGVGGGGALADQVIAALGASLVSMRYPTPDFAGLYQDAAGTTPVTAVGQPVGLMLDRAYGLARGTEIGPTDAWTLGGSWIRTGDSLKVLNQPATSVMSLEIELGRWYEATFVASEVSGGASVFFAHPTGSAMLASGLTAPGVMTVRFFSTSTTLRIRLNGVGANCTISAISVRELLGNHASQPTTTARPTLRSGPLRIDYDGVDDYLRTVFPALGSSVTIARSIPGVGAQYLTGQTIAAGNWDDSVDSCATLVIDRALTGPETALVTAFLNQQAGV